MIGSVMAFTNISDNKIDPDTEIGSVKLAVRDLNKMVAFYQNLIGLSLFRADKDEAVLGVGKRPLVRLLSRPNGASHPTATGLFHLAILLPGRAALGQWLLYYLKNGFQLDGVGDHLVSEALYLSDPEGNGIEMYRDRPRETWEYSNGRIRMDTLAVDLESMLVEADPDPFNGLPDKTKMGHIHLQVNNLEKTAAFYRDILGFDLMAKMPGAGFLSAGGYHHHIGMNTWRSYNGNVPPPNSLGLMNYEVILPNEQSKASLLQRLTENQIDFSQNGTVKLQDPAGIWIEFVIKS
jgi:catechol 2,3-dioxygenase